MKAFDVCYLLMINGKPISAHSDIESLLDSAQLDGPETRYQVRDEVALSGFHISRQDRIMIRNYVFPNPVTMTVVEIIPDDICQYGDLILEANAIDVGSQLL